MLRDSGSWIECVWTCQGAFASKEIFIRSKFTTNFNPAILSVNRIEDREGLFLFWSDPDFGKLHDCPNNSPIAFQMSRKVVMDVRRFATSTSRAKAASLENGLRPIAAVRWLMHRVSTVFWIFYKKMSPEGKEWMECSTYLFVPVFECLKDQVVYSTISYLKIFTSTLRWLPLSKTTVCHVCHGLTVHYSWWSNLASTLSIYCCSISGSYADDGNTTNSHPCP